MRNVKQGFDVYECLPVRHCRVCYTLREPYQLFPDGADYTATVRQVQHILADAMQQFFSDIPFVTEYLLADRWYKGLDDQAASCPTKTTAWQTTGNTAGSAQLLLRRSVAAGDKSCFGCRYRYTGCLPSLEDTDECDASF